jgi:hypothetical protein
MASMQPELNLASPKEAQPTWVETIKQKRGCDTRSQPWKATFGQTTGGLNDEDWVEYPAVCDMAKKGIKG